MKINYICHSALLIETEKHKILTDPWLFGASYCDQWHLFPKPVNEHIAFHADVVLISHGHEDHLHHESLEKLNKLGHVYYPFQWQEGIKEYLLGLGFNKVIEAITYKPYVLSDGTKITYISNALDSIIVIESGGEVLVNINDALPASHLNIIRKFTEIIKTRFPKIDYLFCGYGSAAYFPNTVHCEGKNDREVAEAREQMFAHNFCNIVEQLQPKSVVPFAADFVLLNDSRRWINDIKLSKNEIKNYYNRVFKGVRTQFIIMHSGDVVENGEIIQHSHYHDLEVNERLEHLIEEQLSESLNRVNEINYISEVEANDLQNKMMANINLRMSLFGMEVLDRIKYNIVVKDIQYKNSFFIEFSGSRPIIERGDKANSNSILTIETTSKILNHSFDSEWGGDALVIGYGAEIYIHDKNIIHDSLDIVCVRLLTRQPVATKQMKSNPLRAIRYLLTNPLTTSWALKQFINGRKNINKNPVNERNVWLSKTKCEICQICDIPFISNDFAENLD